MRFWIRLVTLVALVQFGPQSALPDDEIRWLVTYDGQSLPAAPWMTVGKPEMRVDNGVLRLADNAADGPGCLRADWTPVADTEVIVEATVRVLNTSGAIKGRPDSKTFWPWRDGAPVSVLVSDGQHQEGLTFYVDRLATWTDRFVIADTASDFHTYRLVIRDTDMSVSIDGDRKIRGQNAFWKPADGATPFIQFGSTSEVATGAAEWKSVRLGVRRRSASRVLDPVKITLSEPWPIARPELKHKPTRPYVYNLGEGRLLMSVAQGADALYEPYGVMLSQDEGRTWTPIKEWDQTDLAPLPMLRLKNGEVLGMSRWTWPQADETLFGNTVRWSSDLSKSTNLQSVLRVMPGYFSPKVPLTVERHVWEEADGSLRMAAYSKTGPSTPEGLRVGRRFSHLLRSRDGGKTWNPDALIGPGGEPAVVKTGGANMTALLRVGPFKPFHQVFSKDQGQTWSDPVLIEEGSVCADLVMMSNGLLACSYGRPANSLMFSADEGHTWNSHHVVTARTGFNYSGIVEVRPGRLLYVHDAGGLQALHIDVERQTDGDRAPSVTQSEVKPEPQQQAAPAEAKPARKPTTDYALRTAKELQPTRKLVYKTIGDVRREFHLFEPKDHQPTDKRPCYLAIHGGGWVAGTADVMYCVADHYARQGWLGVSMQYRHHRADRGTTVFDAVRDVRSAVRYLRTHAAELGIDPQRIVAGGRSAGGHLAIATALFDGVDEPGEDTSVSCVPNAVICYSAVLDTSAEGYGQQTIGERWQELSPVHHVRAGLPPTLVMHGIRDTITPVAGAKAFAAKMTAAGNVCELVLDERGSHSYMMRTEPLFLAAMQQTSDFLKKCGIVAQP